MKPEEVSALLKKYEENTCSVEEEKLLALWFAEKAKNGRWTWENEEEQALVKQLMFKRINRALFVPKWYQRKKILQPIAAAMLLLGGIITWIYLVREADYASYERLYTERAVEPGTNAALLTLADGTIIRLDEATSGLLSDKHGVLIKKLENGELIYEVDHSIPLDKNGQIRQNTISIPNGGQYQLTLPDGSKVWLNSGSTLIYPAVFVEQRRAVTLIGEAYFEVAHNNEQPFIVKALDNEIEVTGTHFNISAYEEEKQVKTTLVEGGVVVSKKNARIALTPGQQAVSRLESEDIHRFDIDPFYALGWLKGYFVFEDQDIRTIMNDIARWYNVDIQYEGEPNKFKKIGGTYQRSKGIDELLNHLEVLSGMHFTLKERRVIVTM